MTAEEKSSYFKELTLDLQREGFTIGQPEGGLLPVELEEQRLCRAMEGGEIRYRKEDAASDSRGKALERVIAIAKITVEYMTLMEAAPPLKTDGLEGDYRLLAAFSGAVLAGQSTRQGVQFVTWERDFAKTGLCWGHYFGGDYGKAKLDFSIRSGLVPHSALFVPEQLTEVYRRDPRDAGSPEVQGRSPAGLPRGRAPSGGRQERGPAAHPERRRDCYPLWRGL